MSVAYCIRLAESFQRFWNKKTPKISTRLAWHHLQRLSASDAAAPTESNLCASQIAITFSLLIQCLICIQIFDSLFPNVDINAASVEQEAAYAVASVDA